MGLRDEQILVVAMIADQREAFGASGIHSTLMDLITTLKQNSEEAHRSAEDYWKLKTLFEERLNAINQNLPRLEQRIQKVG